MPKMNFELSLVSNIKMECDHLMFNRIEDSKEKMLASSLRSYQCNDISAWENYRVLDSYFWMRGI